MDEKKGEGIMAAKPKSFKINRKSYLASKLKSSISTQLLRFLGEYSDDVLAEYITVLVCNGKHQYQARDDLEAFLGERSGEFVSWLWKHLSRYAHQVNEGTLLVDSIDVIAGKDCDPDEDKEDPKFDGLKNGDKILTIGEKIHLLPSSVGDPGPCNDLESAEGFHHLAGFCTPPLGATNKSLPQTCRSEILGKVSAIGDINNNSLTYDSLVKRSPVISVSQKQKFQPLEMIRKIVQSNNNALPKREDFLRDLQSSISEYPTSRQTCATKVSGSGVSLTSVGAASLQNEKPRGSVWDRLGKPNEDISAHSRVTQLQDAGVSTQEVLAPDTPIFALWNGEVGLTTSRQVSRLGNGSGGSNSIKSRMPEPGASTICQQLTVRNIRGKRRFEEISTCPAMDLVSSASKKNVNFQCKETSQDLKKPNLIIKNPITSPNLISEVLNVKQRLCQVEIEMLKVRAKQLEKENDGKATSSSNSGGSMKHPTGDMDSRTVFVSNVHFAATRQALISYFNKCGVVVNVVILTDKETCRPTGSAYVTFATKESVDKAVALTGSTFLLRTVKVLRKAEATSATSAPTQLAGRLSSAMVARARCHLNSRTIAQANAEQKGVVTSIHQLPTLLESEKTQEKNSSTEPPAVA